jgi:hypothetical protein
VVQSLPMRRTPGSGRSAFVSRSARATLCALLSLSFAAPIAAAQEEQHEGWVPSFALFFDMFGNRADGAIVTSDVMQPPIVPPSGCGPANQDLWGCPESPVQVTFPTQGNDTDVVPLVGASLELMTPSLLEEFLAPRLFAHGDVEAAFGFERNLAGERKPGPFSTDPLKANEFDVFERSVNGQGSRAKIQVERWVFGAGLGVAFTATVFDRTIRIKPSFEYYTHELDMISSVRRAVKQVDPTTSLDGFRLISLSASDTVTLHALGAGLELEADAGRLGPIMTSLFAMGRGYKYTGNLHHTFSDSNELGESATWFYDIDPWLWRAGLGIRFRWVPE